LRGALALVLLPDQVPQHLFRGGPRAFASDAEALDIAKYRLQSPAIPTATLFSAARRGGSAIPEGAGLILLTGSPDRRSLPVASAYPLRGWWTVSRRCRSARSIPCLISVLVERELNFASQSPWRVDEFRLAFQLIIEGFLNHPCPEALAARWRNRGSVPLLP
jgi:hypothetical protein